MDGQRQRSGGNRKRRRKPRNHAKAATEPVLIAARRPNSPLLSTPNRRSAAVASAAPQNSESSKDEGEARKKKRRKVANTQRRSARIVALPETNNDDRELERRRLLDRLMTCEGRGAISKAADAYTEAGFEFPEEQDVQLQLLEHFDEECARQAISTMTELLDHEPPIKRPILEQRLRRLEEYADEERTREAASALRRAIR